jgi:hypothetical protein
MSFEKSFTTSTYYDGTLARSFLLCFVCLHNDVNSHSNIKGHNTHLFEEVDKLLLADSSSELPRLCHTQED